MSKKSIGEHVVQLLDARNVEFFEKASAAIEEIFNIVTWTTLAAAIRLAGLKSHAVYLVSLSGFLIWLTYAYVWLNTAMRLGVRLFELQRTATTFAGLGLMIIGAFLLEPFYFWLVRVVNLINAAT